MKRNILILSLLLSISIALQAQQAISGRVVTQGKNKKTTLIGANVLLYTTSDTLNYTKACITDTLGHFRWENLPQGNYFIRVSYLGYRSLLRYFSLQASLKKELQLHDLILKEDATWIKEVKVLAQRHSRSIDHYSTTFTQAQIKQAYNARDLMINLPNLHINRITNGLASVDGKSVLILINGIKASDQELRMIPADKIKKVDLYDVPPIRYASAGKVVSITTKALDAGYSGNIYANATGFFTLFTSYFSYIHGKNRFSMGYSMHLNNEWNKKKDLYQEKYTYSLLGDDYNYDYTLQEKRWGANHTLRLGYTYVDKDNYIFQIKPKLSFSSKNENDTKQINFQINQQNDIKKGGLQNRVETVAPSLDLYFSKKISAAQRLDLNLLTIAYRNNQQTNSWEKGIHPFKDNMHLKNTKISMIGEVAYQLHKKTYHVSVGYKGIWSYLENKLQNSMLEQNRFTVNTQKHYGYAELGGRYKRWMYRLSLGANIILNKNDVNTHTQFLFSPIALLGYRIDKKQQFRLMYESYPIRPNIQQQSNSSLRIMNQFIRRGNPNLKSALYQDLQLMYNFNDKRIDIGTRLFYTNSKNSLFNYFIQDTVDGEATMVLTSTNAKQDKTLGISGNLSLHLIKGLTIGVYARAIHRWFKATEATSTYKAWFYPINIYLNYRYKHFTFDYYQKLKSDYLEGMYVKGIEKVSYLALGYRKRAWRFALNYYFPFWKNDFSNQTIPTSLVNHHLVGHLRSKEKTLGLTISYCFNTSKKRYRVSRKLNNKEEDTGAFKVK